MSTEGSGSSGKAQGSRAQQLFGQKGGGSPWENASDGEEAAPEVAPDTSSAPYPKDANYTSNEAVSEASSIFSDVDDEAELTKLHPNYKLLMRVSAVILALVIMGGATILDNALASEFDFPLGILTGISVLFGLFLIIRVPTARFNARGYQISHDRLRVVRGIMWHSDTIVPFGRVQHIDVDQGPIDRALGIATMTLHTAGSHNASVRLPGLGHELAVQMREEIREHIKRESM